jgi:hypothetical protein
MGRLFNMRRLRHKYNAAQTVRDGIKFPSKKEANRYDELVLLQRGGEVVMFIRQPMFDLGGGTTYKADFLIFWADGNVTVEDVKGMITDAFRRSKKQVEARYPVKIKIV